MINLKWVISTVSNQYLYHLLHHHLLHLLLRLHLNNLRVVLHHLLVIRKRIMLRQRKRDLIKDYILKKEAEADKKIKGRTILNKRNCLKQTKIEHLEK